VDAGLLVIDVLQTAHTCLTADWSACQIERIQNPALYKQYVIRKTEMDKANSAVQNERTLWHGTSVDTLPSIDDTGFNRSYCGKNGKHPTEH